MPARRRGGAASVGCGAGGGGGGGRGCRGAGEPRPGAADKPLLGIREPDRLLLSPHNAWSPREAIDVLVGCIPENIEEFCKAR